MLSTFVSHQATLLVRAEPCRAHGLVQALLPQLGNELWASLPAPSLLQSQAWWHKQGASQLPGALCGCKAGIKGSSTQIQVTVLRTPRTGFQLGGCSTLTTLHSLLLQFLSSLLLALGHLVLINLSLVCCFQHRSLLFLM